MRILSGIQPSGNITLGNYIGSICNIIQYQKENPDMELFLFIADLHAITVSQDKQALRKNIRSLAALYLACGIKQDNLTMFIQSEVPAHNQLAYIMECVGVMGEFERMTQYKDKKLKQKQGVHLGLLTYPALMSSDILLYDSAFVPVGDDQKQHLELTRDLASRFNARYGDVFLIPEPLINKISSRIMSLQEPKSKMSKSDPNPKNVIYLLEDVNSAKKKIKSAITDTDLIVKYDVANKPGISNLIVIYSSLANMTIKEIEIKYAASNYATFKNDLADIVATTLLRIQARYNEIIDTEELDLILDQGRDKAQLISQRKIQKVYQKIGLGRKA